MATAVILAAGRGERMGGDKVFLEINRKHVMEYSLGAFERCPEIDEIIIVARADSVDRCREIGSGFSKFSKAVVGGDSRAESSMNALDALAPDCEIVAIHDAARPLVTPELVSRTVASARANGSGVAVGAVVDTIKEVDGEGGVVRTIDRASLRAAQTPQAFRVGLLRDAYAKALSAGARLTDDASALEFCGIPVATVESQSPNPKLTYKSDVAYVATLLAEKEVLQCQALA